MSNEDLLRRLEALERKKARHLDEVAAIEREERKIAQLQALAAELKFVVSPAPDASIVAPSDSPLTIKALVECYRTDKRSPYQEVKASSRATYNKMIKQIINVCKDAKVADLDAERIQEFYNGWAARGKIAMGHAFITKLRGLVRFGMNELKDKDCEKVAFILHGMHFQTVKPRKESLTAAQVDDIRARAHELGHHSVALAQAFQFYCGLKQADVIGEWVPIGDPLPSYITRGDEKWVRGIRWNEIDKEWSLRGLRLPDFPEVLAEVKDAIRRLGKEPSGPMIIDERTKQPYMPNNFRLAWRAAADAAKIPKRLRNMDSRPKRNEGVRQNKQNELQRSRPL
jgi:Phage integrase, N-terminal SAM-like domain